MANPRQLANLVSNLQTNTEKVVKIGSDTNFQFVGDKIILGNTSVQLGSTGVTSIEGLSGISANSAIIGNNSMQSLHRSPNAITAMFVYDVSKDSDGGAWTEKCQHTSWYNETIYGKWLGAQLSETDARYANPIVGEELAVNGNFDSNTSSSWVSGSQAKLIDVVSGELRWTAASSASSSIRSSFGAIFAVESGKTYRVIANVRSVTTGVIRSMYLRIYDSTSTLMAQGSTVTGTNTFTQATAVFVANANQVSIYVYASSAALDETFAVDSISVREVVSTTTAPGDYYQLTTDGKFYSLNAGSGVTQVYRGNKRSFPKLAAIVAEAASVTIYDLTEVGRPMWMSFPYVYLGIFNNAGGSEFKRIVFLNGVLGVVQTYGFHILDFISERTKRYEQLTGGLHSIPVALRASASYSSYFVAVTGMNLPAAARVCNDIAATILPDAPVDPVTGLKIPTIAVASNGGVIVVQHSGATIFSSSTSAFTKVTLTPQLLSAGRADTTWYYAATPGSLGASFALSSVTSSAAPDFNVGNTTLLRAKDRASYTRTSGAVVQLLRNNEGTVTKGIAAKLSDTYNTGWLSGDIRRAYIASNVTGSVSGSELVTNGTFDTDTTGWTAISPSTITSVSGKARIELVGGIAGQYARASTSLGTLTANKTYKITIGEFTRETGNNLRVSVVTSWIDTPNLYNSSTSISTPTSFLFSPPTTGEYSLWMYMQDFAGTSAATFDNISVTEVIPDRSYKTAGANINGTLTANTVNTGTDLVAYSGFSANNYIQEPYSADLDFGTGEWSASAWVKQTRVTYTEFTNNTNFPIISTLIDSSNTFPTISLYNAYGANTVIDNVNHVISITSTSGYSYGPVFKIGGSNPLSSSKCYRIQIQFAGAGVTNITSITTNDQTSEPNISGGMLGTNIRSNGNKADFLCQYNPTGLYSICLWTDGRTIYSDLQITSVLVQEVGPQNIFSRKYSSGPSIQFGYMPFRRLIVNVFDGTTTRTVRGALINDSATYRTGSGEWEKVRVNYTSDGKLELLINGVRVGSTTGSPLLTLNNSNAVLTIGNSYTLDAPFSGSIALLKFSATVPATEQMIFVFEQEKLLFSANAKCVLPTSTDVLDLSYDDNTDTWTTLQTSQESTWSGLVRTANSAPTSGSFSKCSTNSGVKLLARTTTNPGVDVIIPTVNAIEESFDKAITASKLNSTPITLAYTGGFTANFANGNNTITSVSNLSYPSHVSIVGSRISANNIPANTTIAAISGTTILLSSAPTANATANQVNFLDFNLPVGYTATDVISAGLEKDEGTTKDYTRLYDGFKETIRFAVAPGNTTSVKIKAIKEQL